MKHQSNLVNSVLKQPTFSLDYIIQQLAYLGISFSCSGKPTHEQYAFKSLNKIEKRGIYFLVKGITKPPGILDSIILYTDDNFGGQGNVTLKVDNPQLTFYQLMESMLEQQHPRGIHPTAIVDDASDVSPDSYIGPYCILEGCVVKAGVRLHSHVVVMPGTTIEEGVTIEPHSTIGATGTAWIWDLKNERRVIQPQTGFTTIGARTFLGSDVTVVRGSVNETTIIGGDCVIAHGSKIGHNTQVGEGCHFANNVSIAGSVILGTQCFMGSASVVRPHIHLADRTVVGAGSVVVKNYEEPGLLLVGIPAKSIKKASDNMAGVPKPLKL